MKKVITLVVMMVVMLVTVSAMAEVKIYDNTDVIGLEQSESEQAFIDEGWDLIVVVECEKLTNNAMIEKDIVRFTDDANTNYNLVHGITYDKYGMINFEGTGNMDERVANCRSKNVTAIVLQLRDYLEEEFPGENFEMYYIVNEK